MKTGKPSLTLINDAYSDNEPRADFFIVIILIINIALHLILFRIYKIMPPESMHIFSNSLVIWLVTIIPFVFILLFINWRNNATRKQKRQKHAIEKTVLQLETKALRAQMNPHFIFNCMNSIKSLIQKNENEKAEDYLTTFSKLIRTIFQNTDKREITLHDEIETCRLYIQLESMRFGNKLFYMFNVDEAIDLKSVMVPALILQPFIENAIWHGIMPKEDSGTLTVTIHKTDHTIRCIIDDNGIGREMSENNFKAQSSAHESKGVGLTQSRLDLDNLLNERNATVEIIDKKDSNQFTGTTVILSFKEY